MGGFDYNIGGQSSGYGNESPREANYLRLSPLLCRGSYALLPCDGRSRVGCAIGLLQRLCRKVTISIKSLVLQVVKRIKKVIAYFI